MAWWRKEQESYDPHELGARRSDPTLAALEPLPPGPRRIPTRSLLVYFVLGVVVVAFIREGQGRSLKVDGSCTKAGYALNKTEVRSGGVIKWSAAGPADSSIVFALDTSVLPTASSTSLLAGPIALHGCKASGRFGVLAPEGDHVLTVFTVTAAGAAAVLDTQKLVLDDPRGP